MVGIGGGAERRRGGGKQDLRGAVRLAIEALEAQVQAIGFDANMAEFYGASYAQARKAATRRGELRGAIALLREWLKQN